MKEKNTDSLTLKWGTLKGWKLKNEKQKELLKKYASFGMSAGCMSQHDTPEQKQIICELIDTIDDEIWLDWDNKQVSRDEAKKYVMEYGKNNA